MHISYKQWLDDGCPKVYCICGCNKEITIKKHHKYCGIPKYINGHNSVGENNPNFGKHHSEETKQKNSEWHLGKIAWNKGLTKEIDNRLECSEKTKQKMREVRIGKPSGRKGKKSPKISGDLNPAKRPEVREKIRLSKIGKSMDEKTKGKISKSLSGEKCHLWKGGKSFDPYCPKFNNRKKEEIREQYDRKCYICGRSEEDNKYKSGKQIKLSVHHIDEDKEQGCNGKGWKLIPLCIHCHGKIKKLME